MNEKSLRILEYDKIKAMLRDRATSDPGRDLCDKLRPSVVLKNIETAQQETSDALSRLLRYGSTSFGSNREFGPAILALKAGSSLSAPELLHLASFQENVSRIKAYDRSGDGRPSTIPDVAANRRPEGGAGTSTGEEEAAEQDSLQEYFDALSPLTPLSTEIRRCILSEEEIADDASPNLKRIRREIRLTGDKIHTQLGNMLSGSYRTYLQDAVITQRDGRYCIPVKSEYKSQVPGMVHDQSSTGSTFFIEPAIVVTLNNKLRELAVEEKEEIEKILEDLSALAAEHAEEIKINNKTMTTLDFIFARAGLALEMNATRPIFNEEHRLNIRKGRHPLIDKKVVVPIDISLGENFDLLIITGPNTGGKTVSLKTVGLFTLMGQSGLHIPALDRSELSVFNDVFADIGDEQSIEQSLSTFSSHMTNIVHILKEADENSLCLFDELGAGTDPTEGAALAISILDHLHTSGIRTMATTHYSELKVYALSTSFVENACCEFDVQSLRPTYRLLIGIPGKSNAFAISKRLGLPEFIIDAAKGQITKSQESFEDLISSLEQSKVTIAKEEEEILRLKKEAEELKIQVQADQEKLAANKEKMIQEARQEARDILQEAKDYADETIKAFRKAGENASIKDLEDARQGLGGKINAHNNKLSVANKAPKSASGGLKPGQIQLGDKVKILSLGLTGTVNSFPDHGGNLFVLCGIMRMQTNLKDLELVPEQTITGDGVPAAKTGKGRSSVGKMRMSKSYSVSPEINLLGMTGDQAVSKLDKYLDDAYLAHLSSVRIVHGKGTGALRQAVHQHLKRVKYVASFRLGEFGEGDSGVTIATFKES